MKVIRFCPLGLSAAIGLPLLAMFSNAILAQPIRDVTPQGVTRIYREENQRVVREPGERLGPVRVLNDGTLSAPSGSVRLYGVKLPALREICRTASGARWTCGARATGALRGFIDSQPVECAPAKNPQDGAIRVCWIGSTNISLWLLEQGWADLAGAEIEKEYRDAHAGAKARRAGIWSDGQAP